MLDIINAGYESLPIDGMFTSDDLEPSGKGVRPRRYIIDTEKVSLFQSQYVDKNTRSACGSFSVAHGQNVMNVIDGDINKGDLLGKDLWSIQIKSPYRGSISGGSYQIDNLIMMKDLGHIDNYYLARDNEARKDAILNNFAISTGSRRIDFAKTHASTNKVAVIGVGAAHLFPIVGYDDDLYGGVWIIKDSGGKQWRDNGCFYVKYEDTYALYTTFVMVDKRNQGFINKVEQDKKDLELAITKKITNGLYLNAWATREQVMLMIVRAINNGEIPSEEASAQIAKVMGIWNGDRPYDIATRRETTLMIAGALGIRTADEEETIKYIQDTGIISSSLNEPILRLHLVYVVMRLLRYKKAI